MNFVVVDTTTREIVMVGRCDEADLEHQVAPAGCQILLWVADVPANVGEFVPNMDENT